MIHGGSVDEWVFQGGGYGGLKLGAASAQQGNGRHDQCGNGHAFSACLFGQADAGQDDGGSDEKKGAQQLVFVPAIGVKQSQQRNATTDQGGDGQPEGSGQWGVWCVGVPCVLGSVGATRGLHGPTLRAAHGGFVDLVSAGSAVRHGVFPVGSGECVRWLLCAGKASPCLCGGTSSK